jgi:tetratricopeptide (TPR) repeat protein
VDVDPTNGANKVLRLSATGRTDHEGNNAGTTLAGGASIAIGTPYQISFKAKWISGSPQINSRLYFNIANAYLESGDTPRAIANYRRSLRLDTTNRDARTNLAYAESLLSTPPTTDANESNHAAKSLSDYVTFASNWLNQFVSPRTVLATAIAAWLTFWAAISARLLAFQLPWKSLATISLLVTAVAVL